MILWSVWTLFCQPLFADGLQSVAQVVAIKGEALRHGPDQPNFKLSLQDPLYQGSRISTAKQAYMRLRLKDESLITVGPESTLILDFKNRTDDPSETTNQVGIVTLIEGQIRAVVSKQLKQANGSKFMVRTPTAVLGVRGTEFQVRYQVGKRETELYVEAGVVAMAHNPYELGELELSELEQLLTDEHAEFVTQSQYSQVLPELDPSKARTLKSRAQKVIEPEQDLNKWRRMRAIRDQWSSDWVRRCLVQAEINTRKVLANGAGED